MNIRSAKSSDLTEILKLELATFSYDQLSARNLRWMLKKANCLFRVMTLKSSVVGYAIVLFRKNSSHARLYSMAINPNFQGMGLGKKFLKQIIIDLSRKKVSKFKLEVKTTNYAAINLYQKFKFVPTKTKLKYYDDGSNALCLERIFS